MVFLAVQAVVQVDFRIVDHMEDPVHLAKDMLEEILVTPVTVVAVFLLAEDQVVALMELEVLLVR